LGCTCTSPRKARPLGAGLFWLHRLFLQWLMAQHLLNEIDFGDAPHAHETTLLLPMRHTSEVFGATTVQPLNSACRR
jgi:hypothetical protein